MLIDSCSEDGSIENYIMVEKQQVSYQKVQFKDAFYNKDLIALRPLTDLGGNQSKPLRFDGQDSYWNIVQDNLKDKVRKGECTE